MRDLRLDKALANRSDLSANVNGSQKEIELVVYSFYDRAEEVSKF